MRMKLRWLLFIPIILAAYTVNAQTAVGTWSNTGPIQFPVNESGQVNGMGRVCQIKFDPTDSQRMYAVSASGGLFISNNNAQTWTPAPGDQSFPTTQCSSVCIDYTNNNTIYLSTGDPDYYYEDYGIWKSTDGGTTFAASNTGIGNRMAVEILMDPSNHNNLVAATDDGIWKTVDAGATWTETLAGGDMRSMQQKPGSAAIMYAATKTDFFKSTDEGSTWTQITSGFSVPANNGGLRIAVSPANPDVVYVGTTDGYGEILKSVNSGATFTNVYTSNTQCIVCYDSTITSGSQGYYNFYLNANPLNANELLLVSHCVWQSMDGGLTWTMRTQWYNQMHTDMHDTKWNPYNNNQIFNANDGGVWMSTDTQAVVWTPECTGLAATEIYHAAQSPNIRQLVDVGTQDNGENFFDGIWKCNRGGDWSSRNLFDYQDGTVYYIASGTRWNLTPLGTEETYNPPFTPNGNANMSFVHSMSNMAFLGYDSLWRSSNINTPSPSWSFIYPIGQVLMDIQPSQADSNVLYLVDENNTFYTSTNALASSPTFSSYNTPGSTLDLASIATYKHNANVVYLSCGNQVYRSGNKGASWANVTGNLPNLNIRKIICDDYSTTERIFVCLGSYVYYKDNTSSNWTLIQGLPTIADVTDMMIYNPGDASAVLRVSTYGRGVWECPLNENLPPAASFTANKTYICPGDTVQFSKTVYGISTSVLWNFPGGTPATSTADSPVVVYAIPGNYDVSLMAIGTNGNDTVVKTAYINASNGQSGTLQEGFEEAVFPPSTDWELVSQSGHLWQQIDTIGGYGLSMHSIMFDNYDVNGNGSHDRIITPKIDLTNADSAYIKFDVAYAYYPGYNDTLQVEVSTDCGKTFIPVYAKDSEVLATAPDYTAGIFIPTATQWRTDSISLNSYIGNSAQIAFDNVGHYGQALYIDNINLVSHLHPNGISNISNSNLVQVYPNPSTGIFALTGTGLHGSKATISCYNVAGALIGQYEATINNGQFAKEINLSRLARGVYEFKIETDGGDNAVKQVVLQ